MIIFYDKRNGKILGTQDMTFVDSGVQMVWDDVPKKYILKKIIGGSGKIVVDESGKNTVVVDKDELWDIMRDAEDSDGNTNMLDFKVIKRKRKRGYDHGKKEIYIA